MAEVAVEVAAEAAAEEARAAAADVVVESICEWCFQNQPKFDISDIWTDHRGGLVQFRGLRPRVAARLRCCGGAVCSLSVSGCGWLNYGMCFVEYTAVPTAHVRDALSLLFTELQEDFDMGGWGCLLPLSLAPGVRRPLLGGEGGGG